MKVTTTDITIENGGSLCNVILHNDTAREWVAANVCLEDWQWANRWRVVIETRYIGDIVEGMLNDGLEVD